MMSAAIPFRNILARDPETSVPQLRGESIGLYSNAQAGVASALASTFALALIFRRIYRGGWSSWEALDVSIIALFVAEIIQGIGHAMDLKWVIEGKAETGTFCTVQGVLSQLGEVYTALATLTIAVQTFLIIWRCKHLHRTISTIIIGLELVFIVLFIGITFGIHTHPKEKYYATPVPYWCWIGKEFKGTRIGGEYVWLWVALIVSLAMYLPLFLLHFGVIKPGNHWYSPKADVTFKHPSMPSESSSTPCDSVQGPSHMLRRNQEGSQKVRVLWFTILYPLLYCILVLPLTIVRWITFGEEARTGRSPHWPIPTFIVIVIFSLSGVFNTLLYLMTRSRFFQSDEAVEPPAPVIRMTSITSTTRVN